MSSGEIVGGLLRFAFFCGEDVGCGDSVGSVYVDCVDYEVRRREAGGGIEWGWGDVLCTIVYDMFWR